MAQMRRAHLLIGILGVIAFLLTGQIMRHHPPVSALDPEIRLMYICRHVYLLGAALVNLVLGLYVQARPAAWKHALQRLGSVLILLSQFLLLIAFSPSRSTEWQAEAGAVSWAFSPFSEAQ